MKLKTTFARLTLAATILSAASASATPVKAVTDSELAAAQANSKSATSEIEKYEDRVADITKKQADAANKKADLEKEAKSLDNDTKKLTESIKSRTDNLKDQARSLQVNQPASSIVNSLINSESLVDAIQKVSAIVTVTDANKQMIKDQQNDLNALKAKSKRLQENYSEYIKLEESLAQSSKTATTAKAELEVAQLSYQATIAKGETERASLLAAKAQAETKVSAAKAAETESENAQESVEKARETSESNVTKALNNQSENQSTASSTAPDYQAPVVNNSSTSSNSATSNNSSTSTTPSTSQPSNSQQSNTSSSTSTGSVWDYRSSFMTSSSNYNGYAGGGCTDYVWQYFAQRGVIIPNVMPGNGKDWAYQMPRAPKLVPGVIASFAAGSHGSSSVYGHVAVVESVNADGSFVVSEGGVGIWGSTRTIPNSQGVTFVLP